MEACSIGKRIIAMSRSRHTTGANTTWRTASLFLALLLLLVLSGCGRTVATQVRTESTPVQSHFSNIPVGTGNNPEPGNSSQPVPRATGNSESIVGGNGVVYVGSSNDRLYALN